MLPKDAFMKLIIEVCNELDQTDIIELTNILLKKCQNTTSIIVPQGDNRFSIINTDEILYISNKEKDYTVFATLKNTYYKKIKNYEILHFIEKNNSDFRLLNSNLLVNIPKIKMYDSYYRKIYFSEDIYINVTGSAMDNIIKRNLSKSYDMYENQDFTMWDYIKI